MSTYLENLLHQAGYKYTEPRRLVAKVLEEAPHHLSANEIWDLARQHDPAIGRMSVYRTLELFTELGFVRPTPQNLPGTRVGLVYVVMQNGHHDHIVCMQCSTVIEFEDCGLEALTRTLEAKYACRIQSHVLAFYGLCAQCATA